MASVWIDSHFHPQWLIQSEDGQCMRSTFEESIHKIARGLMVSIELKDRETLQALSQKHSHLQWSLGVHPCYVDMTDPSQVLESLLSSPSFDAIGETGLDRYHSQDPYLLAKQYELFEVHMEAAKILKKPLIIHTRNAGSDTLAVLAKYPGIRGVIHCFTESMEFARAVFDMGWKISFSGILTFPKAQELRDVAFYAPTDAILIETDAPYLAPAPYRGKANQPHYVQYVAQQLCILKGWSEEECAQYIAKNYEDFLNINRS